MKNKAVILPCAAALLSLTIWTACKKSNSSSTPPPDNTPPRVTLITKATWKYDTSGIDLNKDGTIDQGDNNTIVMPCFKDNTFQFNKDSTGIVNNGSIKCSPTEPQTIPFTWSFSGTDQSVIKSDADPILANGINISSMDSTKIVLYKDTTFLSQSVRFVISLKH